MSLCHTVHSEFVKIKVEDIFKITLTVQFNFKCSGNLFLLTSEKPEDKPFKESLSLFYFHHVISKVNGEIKM